MPPLHGPQYHTEKYWKWPSTSNFQIDNIDLVAAALENAIAGAGGFCCGKKYIVDHQVRKDILVIIMNYLLLLMNDRATPELITRDEICEVTIIWRQF